MTNERAIPHSSFVILLQRLWRRIVFKAVFLSNSHYSAMTVIKSYFFPLAVAVICLLAAPALRAQESEMLPIPIVSASDSGGYHAINQLPESIRQSAPFARAFYEFARHAGTSGVIDNDAYLSTFAEAQQDMLRTSERIGKRGFSTQATEGTWSNIGLTGNDTSNTPSAGITTALVFDPQHPNIMYAGGEGGVWKSYDTGATWDNLTDNILPNLSVASIAVDPVNTETLYVGTGYCYNAIPNYGGSGLYQSTDGGTTFARLTVGSANDFVSVVVDPSKHNIVVASSYDQGTVYRSTNAGTSWSTILPNKTVSPGTTWDIISPPGAPGVSYLIATTGVYKSTNYDSTWTKMTNATNFLAASIGRAALASPTNAPNKIVALMTDDTAYSQNYLYESADAGVTWTEDNSMPSGLFTIPNSSPPHSQGWYDLYLAITPNSIAEDTIYAGGILAYQKSGGNWITYSDYNHQDGVGGYPHVDHHSFAINPVNSNIVYDGDDGGLWINYQAGSNDTTGGGGWQLHSNSMITNRLYHLEFEANRNVTWVGAQDQGLWKLTDGQAPVQEANVIGQAGLGDAMQAIVSSSNVNSVYGEGPYATIVKTNSLTPPSWEPTATGLTDAEGWDNPFKMSPIEHPLSGGGFTTASNILYLGRQDVWQTINGGSTWQKLSASFGLSPDQVYYCSAIGLPNWNANMLYAAGGGNAFKLSTNFGVTWEARANPGFVTAIGTSWTNPGFVLVSLEGSETKVMMSTDSGSKWTNVSGVAGATIPGAGANTSCSVMCVAVDSTNPLTTWYAATDFGVYQTNDAGQHWTFMGPGLLPCRDVQIYADGTTMRVATYGRGIWEVQLPIQPPDAVESNSLSATKSADGTNLVWSVQNEPQGAMFYVERSLDGAGFARIDSIQGTGASEGTQNYSFTDNSTIPGTYLYRIHEIDQNGAVEYSNQVELHYGTSGLFVYQPYPNPFVLGNSASGVMLNFELPVSDNVELLIYDVKGTLVRTLVNRAMSGGPQSAAWDAHDDAGNPVQPGAYFYSIQTQNSGIASGKIMVVRG
jgi:photosystem II stability/assembly factor-like uncharacterized protein